MVYMVRKIPIEFMGDPDMAGEAVRILVCDLYSAPGSKRKRTVSPGQPPPTDLAQPVVPKVLPRVLFTSTLTDTGASRLDAQR